MVEADVQGASPLVQVNWKRNGAWDWSLTGTSVRVGEPGTDGWRHAFGVVQVPEGADELVLMPGVRQAVGERTWFDNACLYLLAEP